MRTCRWCRQQFSDEQPWADLHDHALEAHEAEYLAATRRIALDQTTLVDDDDCEDLREIERYQRWWGGVTDNGDT
jgi:hypothetical protein